MPTLLIAIQLLAFGAAIGLIAITIAIIYYYLIATPATRKAIREDLKQPLRW